MGRQPNKTIDTSDLRPVFTIGNNKSELKPSTELVELATNQAEDSTRC